MTVPRRATSKASPGSDWTDEDQVTLTGPEARSIRDKLPEHVPGELIVKLREGADPWTNRFGARVVERFDFPKELDGEWVRLQLPTGLDTAAGMALLKRDAQLEHVLPNQVYHLDEEQRFPDDLDPKLWGLHNLGQQGGTPGADIDAPSAWAATTGDGRGPLIAVLDTGVDYHHPDLRNNIWRNPHEQANGKDDDGNGVVDDIFGYNAYADTGDPMDGHSHGTHVAGIIAAEGNNGQGVVGVNWRARILPVKVFSDEGRTTVDAILRGILYATRTGARITNCSWGGGGHHQAIYDAFRYSSALHVAAAGNALKDNDEDPHYPASYDLNNLVSVAASDRWDRLAAFSNHGAQTVDLVAPGEAIYSTVPGGEYAYKGGTSMAAPMVTGTAALIATRYPNASNRDIKARLLDSTDRLERLRGKVASGGRLNAAHALEQDPVPPAPPGSLRATRVATDQVTLSWMAPGDDGVEGHAARYELRMAESPIVDGRPGPHEIGFEDAQRVVAPLPTASGSEQGVEIQVVPSRSSRPVHFALRAYDNVGNASTTARTTVALPAANLPFEDLVDSSQQAWVPDPGWARVSEPRRGLVWTDSPAGKYENDIQSSLTSRAISLEDFSACQLMFDCRFALEAPWDTVVVEASSDGKRWEQLQSFTGTRDWATERLSLSAYDGGQVLLRFRLSTDSSLREDGFYLDRIVISGVPE